MVSVAISHCAECGRSEVEGNEGIKLYGNGAMRCHPKCVRKYERRMNKTRDKNGRFGGKLKGL